MAPLVRATDRSQLIETESRKVVPRGCVWGYEELLKRKTQDED